MYGRTNFQRYMCRYMPVWLCSRKGIPTAAIKPVGSYMPALIISYAGMGESTGLIATVVDHNRVPYMLVYIGTACTM